MSPQQFVAEFVVAYRGPLLVTLGYIVLWYALLFGVQSLTKARLKKQASISGADFDRYDPSNRTMLAADRVVHNALEQRLPFLISFWIYAFVVSAENATILGVIYLFARALYPFLLGTTIKSSLPKRLYLSTFTGYVAILYMTFHSIFALLR